MQLQVPQQQSQISIRLDDRMKVHYATADHPSVQLNHRYVTMPSLDFARWKNAGKRTGSNKVTDPSTGQSYHFENDRFYSVNNKLKSTVPVPDDDGGVGQSSHAKLLGRLLNGELIDRKREERSAGPLREFDVDEYRKLKRRAGPGLERDHVPAQSSLKSRNSHLGQSAQRAAAGRGMAIAISRYSHKRHSPTYGGRANHLDTYSDGSTKQKLKRTRYDAIYPASAFHRDAETMLDNNPAAGADGLTQMGAYRLLGRRNAQQHENPAVVGGNVLSQGIDPMAPAMQYAFSDPNKSSFVYGQQPGNRTQGQELSAKQGKRLQRRYSPY
jgi:hypothetical protein